MFQDRHGDVKDVDAYLHTLQRAQITKDYFWHFSLLHMSFER